MLEILPLNNPRKSVQQNLQTKNTNNQGKTRKTCMFNHFFLGFLNSGPCNSTALGRFLVITANGLSRVKLVITQFNLVMTQFNLVITSLNLVITLLYRRLTSSKTYLARFFGHNSEPCGNFWIILRPKLPIIHPDLPIPTRSPNSSVQPEFLNPKFLY